ncbi:MAG TPA: hypothetical protein DCP20_08885 [Coriobacteriia bacterium]|jgi:hypothetical protein|uniref:hypothetical protein n=1 Tax=Anaerosoma tenue TaxID=2933588 RepID=UPI00076D436A|nr:hypothetical protein [Anaerosoma tenue]KUK48337.1 MAG: hypothetical protein XD74_1054 [Actinobacteria bacterium 66_15]MCK8114550.1 hypothetical protein [Anaerosoma tenue]HAL30812.1 hypothetical protein [Coriobacteriia bacterium]
MEASHPRPPLLVRDGTLTHPRDIVRALETVESFAYRYIVDGEEIATGRATLVRIMLDEYSATTLVNGCLFLNVASFNYLNFTTAADGQTHITLFNDGAALEMTPIDEADLRPGPRNVIRLMEESVFEGTSFVSLDDEDDDE